MRNTTKEAANAFNCSSSFKKNNTEISISLGGKLVQMFLFGNLIAEKLNGELFITNAGWATPTTKERLNAMPGVRISQKKRVWYLNGKAWDGKRIKV